MTNYPKVSVVTITYGHEQYISQMLDGVLMQNYRGEIEFIIANDNSPDGTDEIVKNYFVEKSVPANYTIKYTRHEVNKGIMRNFSWALKQASGKYIALCEGDDYWIDSLKLQRQVFFLEEKKEYVLTSHRRIIVNQDSRQVLDSTLSTADFNTQCLLFRNVLKDDFLNYDMDGIINGDTFLLLYLNNFGKFKIMDFEGAAYRVSSAGIWSLTPRDRRIEITLDSFLNILKFFNEFGYGLSAQTVKKYIVDNRTNYMINADKASRKELISLLIDAIATKDLNRVKSVIKIIYDKW